MRHLAVAVAWLALLPVAPAGATAVSLRFHPSTAPDHPASYDARIQAGRGEVNHMTIRTEPGAFTVRSPGTELLAGAGCVAEEPGGVRCVAAEQPELLFAISATLSGGDDDVVATGPLAITIDGRGGNDRLEAGDGVPRAVLAGGAGDDVLIGTAGADELDGGPGRDVVVAGAGDDTVTEGDDAPAAPDMLDGGPGVDRLSYVGRRGGVVVDLTGAGGPAGEPGEGDRIAGLESASGGDGADRLVGDDGPNTLAGGLGADHLDGRGGDDVLEAGAPRVLPGSEGDRLTGGPGDDRLTVWPGDVADAGAGADRVQRAGGALSPAASIDCGAGSDTLVDPAEAPRGGCETLAFTGMGSVRSLRVGRRAVTLRWVDGPEDGTPCGITARFVDARTGRALGAVTRARTAGATARLRVPVPRRPAGARLAIGLARATTCAGTPWPTIALGAVPVGLMARAAAD